MLEIELSKSIRIDDLSIIFLAIKWLDLSWVVQTVSFLNLPKHRILTSIYVDTVTNKRNKHILLSFLNIFQ